MEDAWECVTKDLQSKLAFAVRLKEVVRLRSPGPRHVHQKVLVRFESVSDKLTVKMNCRKIKEQPEIRVWEDPTPAQHSHILTGNLWSLNEAFAT